MERLSDLMKNAQRIQQELARTEVEGAAGGGMVKVRLNGQMGVLSVWIDKEVVDPDDIEMLQDLVASAMADGIRKARALHGQKLAGLAGTMGVDMGSILGRLGLGS